MSSGLGSGGRGSFGHANAYGDAYRCTADTNAGAADPHSGASDAHAAKLRRRANCNADANRPRCRTRVLDARANAIRQAQIELRLSKAGK